MDCVRSRREFVRENDGLSLLPVNSFELEDRLQQCHVVIQLDLVLSRVSRHWPAMEQKSAREPRISTKAALTIVRQEALNVSRLKDR